MNVQTKTPEIEAGLEHLRKAVAENYNGAKMEAGWDTDTSTYVKMVSQNEDQSQFLDEVNVEIVSDTSGPLRTYKIAGSSESRKETRAPNDLNNFGDRTYSLAVVDNDYTIAYSDLDSYSKVGKPNEFVSKVNSDMVAKIREDELWVGFNGTSRATWASDPNMLDIDKGWLQRIRDESPSRVIDEIRTGSDIVVVGPTRIVWLDGAAIDKGGGKVGLPCLAHDIPIGGYIHVAGTSNYNAAYTVDADTTENEIVVTATYQAETLSPSTAKAVCVADFYNLHELSAEIVTNIAANKRSGLKAFMSDTLAGAEKAKLFAGIGGTPTEKVLAEQALGSVGSLMKRTPFGFPDNTMLITRPDNLSIYLHKVWRRKMEDSEKDRGLNVWNERNRDFIVTEYERCMLVENIVLIKENPAA